MDKNLFDYLIVGGGPIGAATAYFLSQNKDLKIGLITQDPSQERTSTYLWAGGSVQYGHWPQEEKLAMTQQTANFILEKAKTGTDFNLIEDGYIFLDEGVTAPSLNIAGVKLITYLLQESEKNGVILQKETVAEKIEKKGEVIEVITDKGAFSGKKVLVATGPTINKFIPDAPIEYEKRVLFVLDIPISKERQKLPHTIFKLDDGWVYFFIKKIGDDYKMIVGQEDLIEHNEEWVEENYFDKLMEMGLKDLAPFLSKAKVEKVLWGFDPKNKLLEIYTDDNQLFAAYCGSAVRACVYIGQKVAEKLHSK